MVTSFILLTTDRLKVNDVAQKLTDIKGISEVYSVSGNYDLVAIVRVASNDELADLVTNRFVEIDGIETTDTMLAFKACLLYTSPSPRDATLSRMPSSA